MRTGAGDMGMGRVRTWTEPQLEFWVLGRAWPLPLLFVPFPDVLFRFPFLNIPVKGTRPPDPLLGP